MTDESVKTLNEILKREISIGGDRKISIACAVKTARDRLPVDRVGDCVRALSRHGIGVSWFTTSELSKNDSLHETKRESLRGIGSTQCLVIQPNRVAESLNLEFQRRTRTGREAMLRDCLIKLPATIAGRRRVGGANLQCICIGMNWLSETVLLGSDETTS